MRRTSLGLALALFAPVALVAPALAQGPAPVRRVLRLATGTVETVDIEEYVAAVVPGEIGGRAPLAALEAQAVAARSYAIARAGRHAAEGADLCDGTHCQVYRGARAATARSRKAVEETRGLVLVQDGRVIAAPFHAACGGRTARPADVWDDEETPVLESVPDDACARSPGARWDFHVSRSALTTLGSALGFPSARFLEVFSRGTDGRVLTVRFVAVGGRSSVVRGYALRETALRLWGRDSVRSTLFDLVEEQKEYLFVGRGTGHGAGLCQEGAIGRARRGESFREILAVYYRGAEIASLGEEGTR
jgi:stage II sporulation protein D